MALENESRKDSLEDALDDDRFEAEYEEEDLPVDDDDPPPRRAWTRWVPFAVAALVLIFGLASLVVSLSHRTRDAREADIESLRNTIASEETQLENLQEDYNAAVDALEKKQAEYDDAKAKADAGQVETAGTGKKSLETLKAEAAEAQDAYSAALQAYDAAVDEVEQAAMGYDDAKNQLNKIQPFLSYATAYQQFVSGASSELPGIGTAEGETETDPQTWYTMIVYPAATQAGCTLPTSVEEFPDAVQAIAAEPAAKVKAYDDAIAASKVAEAKLAEANTAQEQALNAYAEAKEAEKTSEEWLTDCEQEISRMEKRVKELEASIQDVTESLETHRAELKKLEAE